VAGGVGRSYACQGRDLVMSRQLRARRDAPTPPADELVAAVVDAPDLGQVDRGVLWQRLALTQTQLAQLAGLSQRQVSRWAAHGLLPASSGLPGRYNGPDVERVILMQRAVARGYRPTRAAQLADEALARERGNFASPVEPATYELLLSIEQSLAALRESLFPERGRRG
jgi:hypothetical protein